MKSAKRVMVTYRKFINYDQTEDKVLEHGEFTYDTDFIRGEDYTYCNIFDIKSPDEKGSYPADIYKPKGFTSEDIEFRLFQPYPE